MFKKLRAAFVLVIALALVVPMAAWADLPAVENGEVISQNVSLRADHASGANIIKNLKNGDTFEILDRWEQWLYIAYIDPATAATINGWLLNYYVVENPIHITLRNSNTPAYAYPASDSKRVGSLTKFTRLTVITQLNKYWVVSLREAAAAISKSSQVWLDEDLSYWAGITPTAATVIKKTTARTGPGNNWTSVQTLNVGAVVQTLGTDGDWTVIQYSNVVAYVKTVDIAY